MVSTTRNSPGSGRPKSACFASMRIFMRPERATRILTRSMPAASKTSFRLSRKARLRFL
jgi:hypothetical protein